jgi:hypothetical protein
VTLAPHRRQPALTAAVCSAVFLLGLANCLHYGRQGLMPLDQSIVFDAGWRVLSGQVPFRDFLTPIAVTPGYMQAAFFAVFGVTWFAYVLHAAILNGLFAVLVVMMLRRFGLGMPAATICGVASGICFYTPVGTPFADQHAFLFIVAAVWCAAGAGGSTRAQMLALALAPVLLALALLSKQNPGFPGILPVALACIWPRRGLSYSRQLAAVAIGTALVAGFAVWAAFFWSSRDAVATYFWLLPREEGARRGLTFGSVLFNVFDWALLRNVGFSYLRLLPVVVAGSLLWIAVRWTRRAIGGRAEPDTDVGAGLPIALAAALYVVTVVFIVFTKNQTENGLALIPLIVGLTVAGLRPLAARFGLALQIVLLVCLSADTAVFQQHVNRTRRVNDLTFDAAVADAAEGRLPAALSFLRWHPVGVDYTPADLSTVVAFLQSHEGRILVLGDSLFLYGLTGRPSVNPNLWYHPGLTMPVRAPQDEDFARAFRSALVRHQPRYVISEAYRTRLGYVPMADPLIREWFVQQACRDIDLTGTIRVFECQEAVRGR